MMRTLSSLVVIALVLVVSCAKSSPDGGCKPEDMAGLRKALPTINDTGHRASIISVGLGEACTDLPKGIAHAMVAGGKGDVAQRATVYAAAIADNVSFAKLSCPDVEKVFGALAKASPTEQGRLAHQGCNLARLDLVTEAEMNSALQSVGPAAIIAASVFVWLGDHGMAKAEAKSLARGMMALP